MRAAIFDLDGTLIDSMGVWDRISRDFLCSRGLPVPNDIGMQVKDMSFAESADYFVRRFELTDSREELMRIWNDMAYQEYAVKIELKAGARALLTKLYQQEIKLAVATATDRPLTEAVLRRHGIAPLFQEIVTVAEAGKGKDYPDIYQLAARKLKVKPEDCIVFEDCLYAVRGAKQAGMKVWGVYDSFSAHEKAAIESIADGYIQSLDRWSPGELL